ncbi:sigma-70 family RNA polymerase sigma factor [Leucobacter iarius]
MTQRSDAELLDATRAGDDSAFGELWNRHSGAGRFAARRFAPNLDSDDLVSEAYLKILVLLREGKGPTWGFRPYLYRVIQTSAADTGRGAIPLEDDFEAESVPTPESATPGADERFDHDTVARAFAALGERWQSVLWYTEVEGLPPREIASILGVSPNGVSALAIRARKALRTAWLDAHIDLVGSTETCGEVRKGLQRYVTHRLTAGKRRMVEAHLEDCRSCASAAAELRVLDLHIARGAAVAVLGIGGGGALLGVLGHTGVAVGSAAAVAAGTSAFGGAVAAGTGGAAGAAGAAGAGAAVGGGFFGGLASPVALTVAVSAVVVGGISGAVVLTPSDPPAVTSAAPRAAETRDELPTSTPSPSSSSSSPAATPKRTKTPSNSGSAAAGGGSMQKVPVSPSAPPTARPKPPATPRPSVAAAAPSAGFESCTYNPAGPTVQASGHASSGDLFNYYTLVNGSYDIADSVSPSGANHAWTTPVLALPSGVARDQLQLEFETFGVGDGTTRETTTVRINLADCS